VIAAPGDVQEIAGLEDLVKRRTGRRLPRAGQPRALHAIHCGPIEEPPLASLQVEDEHLLVVTMQIEAVQGTPRRVEINLRVAAEERLERFAQAGEWLVQFVDRIERQRRAAPKLLGDVAGADSGM